MMKRLSILALILQNVFKDSLDTTLRLVKNIHNSYGLVPTVVVMVLWTFQRCGIREDP